MSTNQTSRPSQAEVLSGSPLGTSNRLVLTIAEVAVALGVSRAFAHGLVTVGELPAVRVGGNRVVPSRVLFRLRRSERN